MYDNSPETQNATVEDGYVEFTKHFCYLGSFILYNLKDDFDISQRNPKAHQMMGMVKNIWNCHYINLFLKYEYFLGLVINILLFGCKSWALKESSLNNLDVFLHQSIRQILNINMKQVMDEKISNKKIRKRFYDIPDIRRMIAARQLKYVGKVVRSDDTFIPKQLLTAWVSNTRPQGRPLTTNKNSLAKSLKLLYPKSIIERDITGRPFLMQIFMDNEGSLKYWLADALDKKK